jgi:aminoglycoside 6'-N-acetyltransferase I
MTDILVRRVMPGDRDSWAEMRADLWPEETTGDHARELELIFATGPTDRGAAFVAEGAGGVLIGFVEMSVRGYAEGCDTNRVGYCEGWYVKSAYRRSRVGAALMASGIEWARARGCTEFASDALLDNEVSHAAHKALGFEEVCRIVTFKLRSGCLTV